MERFAEFRRIILSAEFRQRVHSEENYRPPVNGERSPVQDWPLITQAGCSKLYHKKVT